MSNVKDRVRGRLMQIATTNDSGYWAERYRQDCQELLQYIQGIEGELDLMYQQVKRSK